LTTPDEGLVFNLSQARERMTEPVKMVRKRDGRLVPFDQKKIADAIFKAALAVGGQDRYLAEDLAEAVTLYLNKNFAGKIPSVEDIQDCVERVLIKTGHARTAKAYILYRQQRARIRQVKEGKLPDGFLEEKQALQEIRLLRDIRWSVRRSDEQITAWNNQRIVEALVRETGISPAIAEVIVLEVEKDLLAAKLQRISSSLIRELVNARLIAYGLEEARNRHSRLGVPFYDVREVMLNSREDPDEISWRLGNHIKKEYALADVFSSEVVDRHLSGEIHIHHLEAVDKLFTISQIIPEQQDILEVCRQWQPLISGEIYWEPAERKADTERQEGYQWQEYLLAAEACRFSERQKLRFGLDLSAAGQETTSELLQGLHYLFSHWPKQHPCFLLSYQAKVLTPDVINVLTQLALKDSRTILSTEEKSTALAGCYLPRFLLSHQDSACGLGQVAINLPRLAARSESREAFISLVLKHINLAIAALNQKEDFWKKRSVFCAQVKNSAFLISLAGLWEAVSQLGYSSEPEILEECQNLLRLGQEFCWQKAEVFHRPVVLLPVCEEEVRERFSRLNGRQCSCGLSGNLLTDARFLRKKLGKMILLVYLKDTDQEDLKRILQAATEVGVQLRFQEKRGQE